MNAQLSDTDDLNNNHIPSEDDIPHLRSLRQECQAEIDSINTRIDELVEQRKLLERRRTRYDTLLAPIKRVPADVLSTIFELATDVGNRRWQFPTVLPSRICQTWRRMAIELPTLWSTIRVVPPEHPRVAGYYEERPLLEIEAERKWEENMKRLLDVLPLWIERSKESPLFVALNLNVLNRGARNGWGGDDPPVSTSHLYQRLVHLVCSVARRWKAVDLDILTAHPDVVSELLALRPEDVPQLATISLQTSDKHRREDGPTFNPSGILAAASLHSATVIFFDLPWTQLSIQWAGLKELQLGATVSWDEVGEEPPSSRIEKVLGPRGVITLLSMCPNLEKCDLAVRAGDRDPRDWEIPSSLAWGQMITVRLPKLTSFRFHGREPPEEIMSSLDLPSLQKLHFMSSLVSDVVEDTKVILSHRFMHSMGLFGSQLTNIRFDFLLLLQGVNLVATCLKGLYNLRDLQLDCGMPKYQGISKAVSHRFEAASTLLLALLTPDGDEEESQEPPLCVKLERFTCALLMKGFSEGQLLQFIVRRSEDRGQQLISRIKEVNVAFGTVQELDIRKELEEKGNVDLSALKLRIAYPDVC